jgi:aromatase
MNEPGHREVEHHITVNAPAGRIYELIARVANWSFLFPPTVYADQIECSGDSERIRIWATANGAVKN